MAFHSPLKNLLLVRGIEMISHLNHSAIQPPQRPRNIQLALHLSARRHQHREAGHRAAVQQCKVPREVGPRRHGVVRPLLAPQPLLHLKLQMHSRPG